MQFLGFGAVFSFIADLVSKLFVQKVAKLTINLALIFSYILIVSGLALTFFMALSFLSASVSYVMPGQFLYLVSPYIPSNLQLCFSVVFSARLLRMSLHWSLAFRKRIIDVSRV